MKNEGRRGFILQINDREKKLKRNQVAGKIGCASKNALEINELCRSVRAKNTRKTKRGGKKRRQISIDINIGVIDSN